MIVIINYGMGNLGSIANMLKKIGVSVVISSDKGVIERAEKLILPGVGAFDNGMKNLEKLELIPLLKRRVLKEKIPILGLCLGMQLFTEQSEEGACKGLSWFRAKTVRFSFDTGLTNLKIPHMGWNFLNIQQPSQLFKDLYEQPRFYFVHSFHVQCKNKSEIIAYTNYGYEFVSAIMRENIMGVQFHPEKSHKYGMKVLRNFAEM